MDFRIEVYYRKEVMNSFRAYFNQLRYEAGETLTKEELEEVMLHLDIENNEVERKNE